MKPREIELTSKKLKSHIICCWLLMFFGTFIFLVADDNMSQEATICTLTFWMLGGIWYVITRFRIWWTNG
jgi:hypothetical protein